MKTKILNILKGQANNAGLITANKFEMIAGEIDRLYNPLPLDIRKDCDYFYYKESRDKKLAYCRLGELTCPCEHYIKSEI